MILLGHNNILSRQLLSEIKNNKIKIGLWYEIMLQITVRIGKII